MNARPESIEGDLMGLTLISAMVRGDTSLIETTVRALRTREDLLGALRVVANVCAATLTVNLGMENALAQVEMYREAMVKEFAGGADA